ncbi:H4MPT-linked C1 transfer pathway protein [Methanophagales archaeon]|nr:MAG: H4MPT-linked C1 transfer pathway protein [Methanophagales archaeon]RJS79536.1 MAG: H4MPT-linked C1 transfer pathway protein [Methanophagales archaeon]
MFIGIDIGGANTKVATSDGGFVDSVYAPLWKNNTILHDVVLSELKKQFEPGIEAVGVVMTGELCDCFATKREGVLHIKSAVSDTFKNAKFFDLMCTFKSGSYVDKDPLSFAATNWLASAKLVSEQYKNAIFVDVGSTTTDVIPIVGGEIKAKRTDFGRLKYGELIYSGILRTPVATLLKKVEVGEEECKISSELFAITADVYLALGYLNEGDYRCETPDSYAFAGREKEEKSRVSALRRLARVVCSDLEGVGEDSAVGIAEQVKSVQVQELSGSIEKIKERHGLRKLVAAGTGDFIAKEAAESLNIAFLSLSSVYGKRISATFPAYAVAKLLEQEQNFL